MSAPSSSVWSGRSPRPQSGAHSVANSSATSNPVASSSAMPNIPTTNNQPVINNGSTMPNISPAPATPPTPTASQPAQTASARPTPPPAQPISPPPRRPAGDIILPSSSPDKPNNNKKTLIIGAIALAGATVIAGLIFLMTGALNNNSAPAGSSLAKFNIYANYILYGEENSTENINSDIIYDSMTNSKMTIEEFNKKYEIVDKEDEEDEEDEEELETAEGDTTETITLNENMLENIEYNYDEKFKIIDVIETHDIEATNTFFENSITRFDDFLQSNNSNQELITNYFDELTFYASYIKTTDSVDEATIIEKVQNSSLDDAITFIQNTYAPYKNLENSLANEYAETSINSYSAWAKIVAWAKENNCLADGAINETCTNDIGYTEDIQNEYEKYEELGSDAVTIIEELPQKLISQCWEISNLLSGVGGNS